MAVVKVDESAEIRRADLRMLRHKSSSLNIQKRNKEGFIDPAMEQSYLLDQETKKVLLSDLEVTGLEEEKKKWKEICIDGSQEEVEAATKAYVEKIELSVNQPLAMIIKKAQTCSLNEMILIDRDPGKKAMERMRDEGAFGKSLHEKPKSSVHGASLAGYIPIDQNLGKAGDSAQASRFNNIIKNRFKEQEKKDLALSKLLAVLNSGKNLTKDQQKKMRDLLSSDMVMAVDLRDKNNNEVLAYRDEGKTPVFAYLHDGKLLYESNGEEVKKDEIALFKKVQVLSYITGVINRDGKYELVTQKITGDHDQLAVGTKISRNATLQDKHLIYEKGFADDVGHSITAALIEETKASGAVRHGQDAGGAGTKDSLSLIDYKTILRELDTSKLSKFMDSRATKGLFKAKMGGNPYPEDFAEGNYAIYQPGGKIGIAHNEKEIIKAYNNLERQGFNIGINPRYGWRRNENNELEIDPRKISAQEFIKARTANEAKIAEIATSYLMSKSKKEGLIKLANRDAENLFKLASLSSLVKLQTHSSEKVDLVEKLEATLKMLEDKYYIKYSVIPPTVMGRADSESRVKEINTMIVRVMPIKAEEEFQRVRANSNSGYSSKLKQALNSVARRFSFSETSTSTKETNSILKVSGISDKTKEQVIQLKTKVLKSQNEKSSTRKKQLSVPKRVRLP